MATQKQITSKIKKWMVDHNLGRVRTLQDGFYFIGSGWSGLVMILDYRVNDLCNLFSKSHGGGSVHLLNDFDDEVLKPLKLHMRRLSSTEIGLFQGRKLPRSR